MAKETKLTEKTWIALNQMRQVEGSITLAELNERFNVQIASANMSQLIRRGLITAEKTEFVCECCGHKRQANLYTLTDAGMLYSEE